VKSIFPSVELPSVAELRELVHHFNTHQQKDSRITFLQFIQLHYGSDSRHLDADANNHQKLPFSKHQRVTMSLQLLTDLTRALEWASIRQLHIKSDEAGYFEMSGFQLIKSFWQPPRA